MTARGGAAVPAVAAVLTVLAVLSATPAAAIVGTVLHGDGEPFVGASVCYIAGGVEVLCVTSNAEGFYELPDSDVDRLRIRADGYLPVVIAAVDQGEPAVMRPAASILVRLRDARSHEPLADGTVTLVFSDGRKLGPAPVNRNGVRIGTQPAGPVVVRVTATGYDDVEPRRVTLVAGEETVVVVDVGAPDGGGASD